MISPLVGQIVSGIHGLLLAIGGLIGYFKAGSRPSLIAGLLSAVAAFAALGLSAARHQLGIPLGLPLSTVLFVLFGYRYAIKAGNFMPRGMLPVVSLIVLGVSIFALDWGSQWVVDG